MNEHLYNFTSLNQVDLTGVDMWRHVVNVSSRRSKRKSLKTLTFSCMVHFSGFLIKWYLPILISYTYTCIKNIHFTKFLKLFAFMLFLNTKKCINSIIINDILKIDNHGHELFTST